MRKCVNATIYVFEHFHCKYIVLLYAKMINDSSFLMSVAYRIGNSLICVNLIKNPKPSAWLNDYAIENKNNNSCLSVVKVEKMKP